ncbi:MAG: AMP-binding protein, partial [Acidimicrobiia bacterium]|nr:AMP-binding protein [Acidimicrobiia bacterium]
MRDELKVKPGEAVGTFAWNNLRHHELYWATANTGRICHTLNIRLFPDQLAYIVNHGRDRIVFVDPDLVPLVERFAPQLTTVERFVVMGDEVPSTTLPNTVAYEDLLAAAEPWDEWPLLDEQSPMMYCYTSGTTGNPKGVAYTQRSTYMHTISNLANFPISAHDNVLPVVPMFHAAAWGYPFQAVATGAKLTYPGPDLSPKGLVSLFNREGVTFSAGVPTVWLGIQQYLMDHPDEKLTTMRSLLCGGSAVPRALIRWFAENQGFAVVQGWGMTETNPVAAVAQLKPGLEDLSLDEQLDRFESAGL